MINETNWLLPGLGADSRLFANQREHSDSWLTPKWIQPNENESLSHYVERWLGSVEEKPSFVTGISFGGIVALEIARQLDIKGVVIISGCFSKESITTQFKAQAALLKFSPDVLLRYTVKEVMFPRLSKEENLSAEHIKLLEEMAADFEPYFFRWATERSANWEPIGEKSDYPCPILQIHGANDNIIPAVERDTDIMIKDGKHLIQFTHAHEINQHIQNFIEKNK